MTTLDPLVNGEPSRAWDADFNAEACVARAGLEVEPPVSSQRAGLLVPSRA